MKYIPQTILFIWAIILSILLFKAIYQATYQPAPKIGQVYTWNNDNPFTAKESYKDSITNIKGDYIQFDEYLNDTIVYTNASCTISEFLKENKLLK